MCRGHNVWADIMANCYKLPIWREIKFLNLSIIRRVLIKKFTLRRKDILWTTLEINVLSSPLNLDCSHLITSIPNKMMVYLMQTVKIMDLWYSETLTPVLHPIYKIFSSPCTSVPSLRVSNVQFCSCIAKSWLIQPAKH